MKEIVLHLIHYFNYCSVFLIISVLLIFVGVWGWAERLLFKNKKAYRIVNGVMLAVTVFLILGGTVLFRKGPVYRISLIPFELFYRSFGNKVLFRSIVMNIGLFIPLALFGYSAFHDVSKKIGIWIIALAAVFSLSIEALQYLLSVGCVEVDDVICNTLGAAAGCGIYRLYNCFVLKRDTEGS